MDRRLGGTQKRSGRGGEEKNSHPQPVIEPPTPDRRVQKLIYNSVPILIAEISFNFYLLLVFLLVY